MKKNLLFLIILLFTSTAISAQDGFGVKGGLILNTANDNSIKDLSISNKTGYQIGMVYNLDLILGFSIQPELVFAQQTHFANYLGSSGDIKMSYLQVPFNIQWGIDLLLLRPYVFVSPFVNYVIDTKSSFINHSYDRLQGGIGLGAGLDIWKLQISGKYSWNRGSLGTIINELEESHDHSSIDLGNNRSFELSVAFIF